MRDTVDGINEKAWDRAMARPPLDDQTLAFVDDFTRAAKILESVAKRLRNDARNVQARPQDDAGLTRLRRHQCAEIRAAAKLAVDELLIVRGERLTEVV